ncbi:hypothetical protein [Parafrankia sp. BMG5.11]|uniref:hypothetical protein n=1 Tax=Parafrankia sp. BMG5.11 TaxID=222540 RepID=UPI001038C562|nr:hypothetical protein [Parafrankia sp. BMG5.11]TCJ36363.1 hypothetical protein E0504_23305 [Parafrankia sp. BMG5.11]
MLPFDSNDYRRRVLAAVHARGGAEQSDPFELYDIPIEEAPRLSDEQVRVRVDAVWAFWQRSRDHPRYRGVIIALLGLHDELSAALATAASRAELAARVGAAREARDGERFAELDAAVRRLVSRFGGLPEDKLAGLRALAAAHGVDDAAFALRTRRYRVLPAGTPERADATSTRRPVPAEVIRQVRADLDELGRIAGVTPPRSLFDLLGIAPGASREEIRAVRDAAAARNRERRPDRRRALLDDLLTAVRALLVDGDPEAYLDALVEPVKIVLRPRVATAVLIEDRLLPSAAAELVAAAETEGLDPGRARAVVADLAREHGVDAPVVARTPRSGAGSPAGGPSTGAAFDGDAGDGPGSDGPGSGGRGSGGRGGPSPVNPVPVRPEPVRAADWQSALSRARAALRAGRPIAASDEITRAREIAGETLPPIRAVGDEVERAIRAAGERWRAIVAELAANRQHAVVRLADELARLGADVPGPDGRVLDEVRAAAQARCARADDLVRRARAQSGPERIRLAREALALAADHDEAQELAGTSSSGAHQPQPQPQPSPSASASTATAASDAAAAVGSGADPLPASNRPGRPPAGQPAGQPSGQRVEAGRTAEAERVVEPPSGVAARWDGASVVISWRPTTTPGEARYRIRRITADGNSRAVGVTSATTIEDGGVFRGASIPEYEVIAGIDGAWSRPARWPSPTPTLVPTPTPTPVPIATPVPGPATAPGTGPARAPEPARDAATRPEPAAATSGAHAESGGHVEPGRRVEPGAHAESAARVEAGPPSGLPLFVVPPPGPHTAADDVGPVPDLRMVDGRLCWTWPVGCTEMMVTARADLPPAGAQELGSTTRKVTNTRYDIDGGFLLPAVRPLHVALFACVRVRGELVVAGTAAGRCLVDPAGGLTVVGPEPHGGAGAAAAGVAGSNQGPERTT